jgi:hypothetical protein
MVQLFIQEHNIKIYITLKSQICLKHVWVNAKTFIP